MSGVTPLRLQTEANPEGTPIETFDATRAGVSADGSQFFKELAIKFFGANRKDHNVSQGLMDAFWLRCMQTGLLNELKCIKAFSETDFMEDLKKFDIPTLIIHGDDNQIVPIDTTAKKAVKLIKDATLKIYPGGSHELVDTHKDQLNADFWHL